MMTEAVNSGLIPLADKNYRTQAFSISSKFSCLFVLVVMLCFFPKTTTAQLKEMVEVSGYVKELGQLSVDNGFKMFHYDNILHHRFETEWTFSDKVELNADLRSRLLNGYSVQNSPGLGLFYEQDPNFADLSRVWIDEGNSLLHSQIDRLHLSYFNGPLEVYAGRHRINWGKTLAWNPNDLFNNYAFLDFDYEERPGVDAISAIYNLDFASSVEAGIKVAGSFEEMVIAGMYRTNWNSYDFQLLGGHYLDKVAAGFGWAGYMKDAGFKGELTYFHPEENFFNSSGNFSSTIGFDYMFKNSVYAQAELLYNGGYQQQANPLGSLTQPPSADNLFIAKTGYLLNASVPLSPLTGISTSIMGSFTRSMVIFIPQVSYSLSEDIDLLILSQLLKGTVFRDNVPTPNILFARLRWSY
ncbi:MAG: hypothetical protein FH748_15480 [Balneolaceae bacterium]|nr:hypothetical protein [Balneolaceae bacterium]